MAESGIVLDILQNAVDNTGHSISILDESHYHIHEGKTYASFLKSTNLAASSYLDMELIPTSTTAKIHIIFEYNFSGGLAEIVIGELTTSSTYSHGATSVTAVNNNRWSTNSATLTVYTGSSQAACISSTMTSTQSILLKNYYDGSTGTALSRAASVSRELDELILKSGTTTVLRIYNQGAAGAANIRANWYEE